MPRLRASCCRAVLSLRLGTNSSSGRAHTRTGRHAAEAPFRSRDCDFEEIIDFAPSGFGEPLRGATDASTFCEEQIRRLDVHEDEPGILFMPTPWRKFTMQG